MLPHLGQIADVATVTKWSCSPTDVWSIRSTSTGSDQLKSDSRFMPHPTPSSRHLSHFHIISTRTTLAILSTEGTKIKDASEILPVDKIFKYKYYDTYSGFANLFRYALLLKNGGYWTDLDIVCLRPFDFEHDYIFAGQRIPDEDSIKVNNCIIKSPPHSPIMEYCYSRASKKNPSDLKWGQTGPVLLTEAVLKYELQSFVAVPDTFCPIDWWNWKNAIDMPYNPIIFENSFAIHLWNEMWRRNKINKSGKFADNCIYEKCREIMSPSHI